MWTLKSNLGVCHLTTQVKVFFSGRLKFIERSTVYFYNNSQMKRVTATERKLCPE